MFWYLAQSSTIFHKDIMLWVRIPPRVRCTHYLIKFVSDLRQVGVFSPTTPVSYTNKTDRHDHDIPEILLKEASNAITLTPNYRILAKWIISILHPNTLKQKKQHQQFPLSYFLTFTSNYTNCQLFTRFYDKIADFSLAVIHFPHLYSNMSTSQVY